MSKLSEQHFLAPRMKARLLVVVRAVAAGHGQAQAHKAALAEQAGLIPDFGVFRQLCLEDLAEAYREDRLTGGAGNDALRGGAGSDTYVFAPGDG